MEAVSRKVARTIRVTALATGTLCLSIGPMAQQGATLQNYNNELVKCIEDLREKREEVNRAMLKEEEEKAKIQKVS